MQVSPRLFSSGSARMKKVVVALSVVVVLVAGVAGGAFVWLGAAAASARGPSDAADVEFVVEKGATGQGLGRKLAEQGLITSPLAWRWHLRERGGLSAKAGKHKLSARMTIPEIARALETPPKADEMVIKVIEGWRLRDTDAALTEQKIITPGAYIAAAKDTSKYKAPFPLPARGLEGYLYPESYNVAVEGFTPEKLIQRQLDTFNDRFYTKHKEEIEKSGRSLDEIVIMASLLEREEPVPAQRPLVAGILWKRIDKGFPLGVDATSRYELAEWNDRTEFLKKLRDTSDAFNTRHNTGLPPSPIGAATLDSLVAALRPQKSEFLYYLHDANRVLHPSRNAEEHEALRKKYNVY
jgi:UPF0755 protein